MGLTLRVFQENLMAALELSFASDLDDNNGALSPPRVPPDDESSASLDTMIFNFRSSSYKSNPSHTNTTTRSTKTSTISPTGLRQLRTSASATQNRSAAHAEEEMSPMPKLTTLPKPKPSLMLQPKTYDVTKATTSTRTTASSSSKIPTTRTRPASPPSPLSSLSPPSIDEEIEEELPSISTVIEDDIGELNRMIRSSLTLKHAKEVAKSKAKQPAATTEEIDALMRESTRFRQSSDDFDEDIARSLVLLRQSAAMRGTNDREAKATVAAPTDQGEEDSFMEELHRLAKSHQEKLKQAKNDAAAAPKDDEQKVKIAVNAGTADTIKKAAHDIDQVLLLALQPFEKLKQEQDKAIAAEEKKQAAIPSELPVATRMIVKNLDDAFNVHSQQREVEEKAAADAAEAAKAEEAAKKKTEEDKKASEAAETKRRENEILSLIPLKGRLLTSSADVERALVRLEFAESRAHEAVRQALQLEDPAPLPDGPAERLLGKQLEHLRTTTFKRIHEIEERLHAPTGPGEIHVSDWHDDLFMPSPPAKSNDVQKNHKGTLPSPLLTATHAAYGTKGDESFKDTIQREIVEKLDVTMMTLKHVLGITRKEEAEAEAARKKEAAEAKKKQEEDEKRAALEKKTAADAEAARQRVMGLTSLDQVHEWVAADDELHGNPGRNMIADRAMEQIQAAMDTNHEHASQAPVLPPAFMDTASASKRFEWMEARMRQQQQQQQSMYSYHNGGCNQEEHRHGRGLWHRSLESPSHHHLSPSKGRGHHRFGSLRVEIEPSNQDEFERHAVTRDCFDTAMFASSPESTWSSSLSLRGGRRPKKPDQADLATITNAILSFQTERRRKSAWLSQSEHAAHRSPRLHPKPTTMRSPSAERAIDDHHVTWRA